MRDKESFNYKLVRGSTGRLADEAKRDEYERQMPQFVLAWPELEWRRGALCDS